MPLRRGFQRVQMNADAVRGGIATVSTKPERPLPLTTGALARVAPAVEGVLLKAMAEVLK